MLLKKKEISNLKTEMNVYFEKVADDLLMVSLTNQIEKQGISSYWRLTRTVAIPPLEIGVDCKHGVISCITFFVDRFAISDIDDFNESMIEQNVMVDTSIFTKDNDYYDVNQSYEVGICNNRLICSFVAIKDNIIAYRNDRVEIYVDSNNCIVGFSVCDLSEDEKCLIKSIKSN
jgi:hypothetical protein